MAAQLGDDVLPDAVGGHVEGAAKLAEADGFIGLSEERGIRLGSKPLDVDLVLLVLSILLHVALMPLLPGHCPGFTPVTDSVLAVAGVADGAELVARLTAGVAPFAPGSGPLGASSAPICLKIRCTIDRVPLGLDEGTPCRERRQPLRTGKQASVPPPIPSPPPSRHHPPSSKVSAMDGGHGEENSRESPILSQNGV